MGGQAIRETGEEADRQECGQASKQAGMQACRHAERQAGRRGRKQQAGKHAGREGDSGRALAKIKATFGAA